MDRNQIFGARYLFFLLIFTCLLLPVIGVAQPADSERIHDHQYVVEREFTTENGLPANGVNKIYQDHKGYIWAATYNGLIKYNGSEFKLYNTANLKNLQSNRFTTVSEDHEGKIWAGLEYGNFLKIDEEKDTTITYLIDKERLGTSVKVNTLNFDSDNTPWIGTSGGLITVQNGDLNYLDHLPQQIVKKVIHTDNYIYVLFAENFIRLNKDGSIDKVIARLREDAIYFENSSTKEFQNVVSLVDFQFLDGNLYLMSEAGLIRYDDNEPKVVLQRDQAGQSSFQGFKFHDDSLYIYGRDGLFKTDLSQGDFVYYTRTSVVDLLIDHEESLWIATTSNGIRQYISTPIYQGPDYSILDEQGITAILESRFGSVFAGANCDGIYEFSDDEVRHYSAESGIDNVCVWSLMEEEDGTLWVGTWGGGVYYRSPGQTSFDRFQMEPFVDVSVILALFKDQGGNIWLGSYHNGLFRYDGSQTEAITNTEGEALTAVRRIYQDNNGDLYVATDEGIGLFSGDQIKELENVNLLETSNFRTIIQDSEERYWFGSYGGGLVVYEPGQEPMVITTENGLFDNTISQLSFDDDGNLWLGGNLGISFIEKDQINQFLNGEISHLRVSRLGVDEGMTIRETNGGFMPSSQMTPDGKLLIPTVQGVNVIDTSRMEVNREVPNVFVDEIEMDGKIFFPDEIQSIPHDAQRVVFRFSGLSYKNPRHNQYEYILEGFDNGWRQIENKQEAVYSSLPHGDYTLKVRASNNDGFWSMQEASVSFEVIPPFWRTTWFFLGSTVLMIALIVGGFRYRLRSIQRNNRQLQKMVDERTEELSVTNRELKKHIDEKNRLQSILAHDLRNPFSAILGYIELIKNEFKEKGDSEHVEMMKMLLDSGRNTLNLLENLLQWSGSRKGGLEANFEAIDINELVDEAISMTEAQSSFKNIFVRNLIDQSYKVWVDRNMILSVIRNLLSNAIKFSGRDSIVEISLKEADEKVIISVEDSGVGIPEEEVDNLFSSAGPQQKVGTQGEKGIGMGLMLCKEFIDKHDEEIWVESTPKQGSTFSFSLKKAGEFEKQINDSAS